MRVRRRGLGVVWLLLVLASSGQAQSAPPADEGAPAPDLLDALRGGRTWVLARYRYEFVDDGARPDEAHASTLRTVLGYETDAFHGLRGALEFENVTAIGNDLYDSTTNGEDSRAVVADPEGTEVNQAYLRWEAPQSTELWLGRRRFALDNHRFIGDVAWRQNDQTYDALGADWRPASGTRLFYSYLFNVNRSSGDDSPVGDARMASHLLNASHDLAGVGRAVAYWYYLDVDAPSALDGFSTSTVGARLSGEHALDESALLYSGELARQTDTGDNPSDVDAGYWLAELGVRHKGTSFWLGYEVLEGSRGTGDKLTTPLATLHAHNGWADKFLVTPDQGLQDAYAKASGTLASMDWVVAYHGFQAETGGDDFGTELDASLGKKLCNELTAGVKLASYDSDGFARNTTKLWLWLSLSL